MGFLHGAIPGYSPGRLSPGPDDGPPVNPAVLFTGCAGLQMSPLSSTLRGFHLSKGHGPHQRAAFHPSHLRTEGGLVLAIKTVPFTFPVKTACAFIVCVFIQVPTRWVFGD